jgi:Protein of unknown function (DUF1554)
MKPHVLLLASATVVFAGCDERLNTVGPTNGATPSMFVSSTRSVTGNLGGLHGADATCQSLAAGAGLGSQRWRAYLSVEHDADNGGRPTDARSRIGQGPWFNINRVLVARDLADLHARTGDADLFLDEHGQKIPGQWTGSPAPVEHDILTGSNADGTLMAGLTCNDWTSSGAEVAAQVGHADGLGPNQSTAGALASWNSAHANQNCSNTAPRGGAGRIYCFAGN